MQKLITSSVFLVLFHFHGFPQTNPIDSLNRKALAIENDSPDSAIILLREAIILSKEGQNSDSLDHLYTRLGILYDKVSLSDSAFLNHQRAYQLRISNGVNDKAASSFLNMGSSQYALGDYEQAKDYFNEAIRIFPRNTKKRIEEYSFLGKAWNNLALCFLQMAGSNDSFLDSAFYYSQKAMNSASLALDSTLIPLTLDNLGVYYRSIENPDSALYYFSLAQSYLQGSGNLNLLSSVHNNLGAIYLDEGEAYQARDEFLLAAELADSCNNLYDLGLAYYNLSVAYEIMDSLELAILYLDEHLTIESRRLTEDKKVSLLRQHSLFQIDLKEQERQLAASEARESVAQRNVSLIALLATAILAIAVYVFFRNRIKLQHIHAARAAEQQRNKHLELIHDKEVEALQNLMDMQESERSRIAKDLHDQLGNSLITARLNLEAIETNAASLPDQVTAPFQTTKSSLQKALEQVRSIAFDMNSGIMAQFGLRRVLTDLVDGIRTAGFMDVELLMPEEADQVSRDHAILLYRITQELINNAVKHSGASTLSIQVLKNDFEVTLMVEDNGQGFDPASPRAQTGGGMGLDSMRAAIEEQGGEYSVRSAPGQGTSTIITLPIESEQP